MMTCVSTNHLFRLPDSFHDTVELMNKDTRY